MPTRNTPPVQAIIYAYQVGFGDCFLLRFDYEKGKPRHVLIDFGTMGLPHDGPVNSLEVIARDIAVKCEGKLDAVVATHRHADHISGFATRPNGKGPGDLIRALEPSVVLQPWTETPDLAVDATQPTEDRAYGVALKNMNLLAERTLERLKVRKAAYSNVRDQLRFIGEDNISNKSAVKNLQSMGKKRVYAYHGGSAGLGQVLPGVKVHVLGPPTVKQTDAIRKQRARDPDEFWHLQLKQFSFFDEGDAPDFALFPGHPQQRGSKLPREVRWLSQRIREAQGEQALELVRMLDRQMNNTSLILLFEAGSKKLLFPGDAQIENWEYALSKGWVHELLAGVDLYKVGHHGSLNATPKSMWKALLKRGDAKTKGRLTTLLSTMEGHHGNPEAHTEVPRKTLVRALKDESTLYSTQELERAELHHTITIDLR